MYDPVSTWLSHTPNAFNLSEPREVPEYTHYVKGNGQRVPIVAVIKIHPGTAVVKNARGAQVEVPISQLVKRARR